MLKRGGKLLFMFVVLSLFLFAGICFFIAYICDSYLYNSSEKANENEEFNSEEFNLIVEKTILQRKATSMWYDTSAAFERIKSIDNRLNQIKYEREIKNIDHNEFMNDCEEK